MNYAGVFSKAPYCLLFALCVCAGSIGKASKRGGKKHPTEFRGEGRKEWQTKHTNAHTHKQLLSKCDCVVVLGAGEGTGREWSSDRQSSSAGDRDEETDMKRQL